MKPDTQQENIGSIFIQNIMSVDCAIFDPTKGIIGQSWQLDVEVTGQLGENHFVHDFSKLKDLVKTTAKTSIDHALIIPIESRHVNFSEGSLGEVWEMTSSKRGKDEQTWKYICPTGAVYPLRSVHVKKSILEQELNRLIRHRMPSEIIGVKTHLKAEKAEETAAFFHYTHGITGHYGLCQRLFHGHRSRIEVTVGDERRPDLEHYIARELFHSSIHIVTDAQVVTENDDSGHSHLRYEAQDGYFEAWIPQNFVYNVELDTSVECITNALASHLREKLGGMEKLRVKCFEGIGKGAIAEA